MATAVGDLVIRILGDKAHAANTFKSTAVDAKAMASEVKTHVASVGSALRGMAGALGVGLGVGAGVMFVKGIADEAERLLNTSRTLGISTDYLQQLGHTAALTAVDVQALTGGMVKMQKATAEAFIAGPKSEAAKPFRSLNVELANLIELSPQAQFEELSRSLIAVENPLLRNTLAVELFGKSWKEIAPAIDEVAKGLAAIKPIPKDVLESWDRVADKLQGFWSEFKRTGAEVIHEGALMVTSPKESARRTAQRMGAVPELVTIDEAVRERFRREGRWPEVMARAAKWKVSERGELTASKEAAALRAARGLREFETITEAAAKKTDMLFKSIEAAESLMGQWEFDAANEGLSKFTRIAEDFIRTSKGLTGEVEEKLRGAAKAADIREARRFFDEMEEKATRLDEEGAARITERFRTPAEELQRNLREIDDLRERGFITPETHRRAQLGYQEEYSKEFKLPEVPSQLFAEAATGARAYSAILEAVGAGQRQQYEQEALRAAQATALNTERIRNALLEQGPGLDI